MAVICRHINEGAIPCEWGEVELRVLVASHYQEAARLSKLILKGKRLRDFNNTVLVNNL